MPSPPPHLAAAVLLWAAAAHPVASAESPSAPADTAEADDDFSDFSLEALLEVEVVTVTSGSRQAAPLAVQPVPVAVVSAEDLHFGGFTDLADALTFTPGIDVRRQGRTTPAIGVRGLTGRFSDRTLLLINGRFANESFLGSIQPQLQPVHLEDVERVEVVRGPGGAVWGPNALNGVINVITKAPRDTQGLLVSAQVNDFGDLHGQARLGVGAPHDPASDDGRGTFARLSAGYDQLRETAVISDSPDQVTNFPAGPAFFNDDLRRWSLDFAAEHDAFDATTVSAGVATSQSVRGNSSQDVNSGQFDDDIAITRVFVAADQGFENGGSARVQAYLNHFDNESPLFFSYTTVQSVLEAQGSLPPIDGHSVTFGGQVSYLDSGAQTQIDGQPVLSQGDGNFLDAGAFVADRWTLRPGTILESQGRFDHFEEDGPAFAGRLAGLQSLDAGDKHVLRIAAASAVRSSTPGRRDADVETGELPSPPFPPGQPAFSATAGENNDEERTWGFELGYRGQLSKSWSVNLDGYWQRYEGLAGFARQDDPFGLGRTLVVLENLGDAQGWGAEAELAYERPDATFSAWYAYHGLETDESQQSFRAADPIRHSVGLRARRSLTDALTLSANFRFDDAASSFDGLRSGRDETDPAYRLDLTAAHDVFDGRGEVLVGVRDVLDQADPTTFNQGTRRSPDPEGRSFFLRLQARF